MYLHGGDGAIKRGKRGKREECRRKLSGETLGTTKHQE